MHAAPVEAGFKDHSFAGPTVNAPTQDKPQSKVWFADGHWWGGLFVVDNDGEHRIHRYNSSNNSWTDTGVVVDGRNRSHADYLWDGTNLYVASVNNDSSPDAIRVFKLNYDASTDTYSHDPGFGPDGVIAGYGPSETVTIAKDSTGQLWVTFQADTAGGRDIMVNRSTTNEQTWGDAFSIGTASGDDISAIIAFGGHAVGVMWSDQNPAETQTFFYWSEHADTETNDTAWTTKKSSAQGTEDFAEDHINLKLVATNSGEVLAAVKTNGGPNHIQVLRRNAGTGNWSNHVVVGEGGAATRPQIVVDATNSRAYVFYTVPERSEDGDQAIHYKSAPLSTLDFTASGLGAPFIKDATVDINDVSTAKHSVTSAMGGILAIASGDNDFYYHGWLPLGAAPEGHPFTDIDGHPFEDEIIWLWENEITGGCTPTTFCPGGSVTRVQMAQFLDRALGLPAASKDYFTDDNGITGEASINRVAEAGITTGCTETTFCPREVVTRVQMAQFLDRALGLGPASKDYFTDDNGITGEASINRVAEAGITTGCTTTTYCPRNPVTRGQMAAFLYRALAGD